MGLTALVLLITCNNLATLRARARERPRARDGRTGGDRRLAPPARLADAHREPAAGRRRRVACRPVGPALRARAGVIPRDVDEFHSPESHCRLAAGFVRRRGRGADGAALWTVAGAPGVVDRSHRRHASCIARSDAGSSPRATPARARGRADRDLTGAHFLRAALRPDLPQSRGGRPGVRVGPHDRGPVPGSHLGGAPGRAESCVSGGTDSRDSLAARCCRCGFVHARAIKRIDVVPFLPRDWGRSEAHGGHPGSPTSVRATSRR